MTAPTGTDVRGYTFLEGGRNVVSEDGPYVGRTEAFDVAIRMAQDIGDRFAGVWVLVTAIDPATGSAVGSKATEAVAYREADGTVRVLRQGEAEALTLDAGVEIDGLVEEGLVGREVTP